MDADWHTLTYLFHPTPLSLPPFERLWWPPLSFFCVHRFSGNTITLGARGDSYYEYLLKQWLLTNKRETVYKVWVWVCLLCACCVRGLLNKKESRSDSVGAHTFWFFVSFDAMGRPCTWRR